jgi:signal transduction histidine kinase
MEGFMYGQSADAYALAGAISLAALAALHGLAWRTLRRRWCAAFALAMLLAALIYAFEPYTRSPGTRANPYTMVLAMPALLLLIEGWIDHASLGPRLARVLRVGGLTVALVTLAVLFAFGMSRLPAAVAISLYPAAIALTSLLAARREPDSGHGLVFLSMMLFPAMVLAGWAGLFPVPMLRYVAIVPVWVAGVTWLTTGLVRAHRAGKEELRRAELAEAELRALNESLEQRVVWRTEELHELIAGLESFNRQVSHDLRGPLSGILGASRWAYDALKQGDLDTVGRVLEGITAQASSSVELVAALLSLARAGNAPFSPKRVALEPLVRQALEQVRLADPHRDVPVTVSAALPEVEADPDLLRQVYVNLVANAVKFSSEVEQPRVEVGVMQDTGPPKFYVRDNGVGFDGALAEELFQPFKRMHHARFAGHGVGLSIVKQIVQRHGGHVWAEGAPGRGATFFFTLGQGMQPEPGVA